MMKLNCELNDLQLSLKGNNLDIFYKDKETGKKVPVQSWSEDEVEEDPQFVMGAMLIAVHLFYTNRQKLVDLLGYELEVWTDIYGNEVEK